MDSLAEAINDRIPFLTENDALSVLYRLQIQFGWAGTMFTRADAEQSWRESWPLMPGQDAADLEMPDDLWEKVQSSRYWRKGIPEMLTEQGWDLVTEAVEEALSQ